MSRFFASTAALSDSDESSSEEELLMSTSEEEMSDSSEESESESEQEQDVDEDDDDSDDSIEWDNDDDTDSDSDDEGARRGPSYFLKKGMANGSDSEDEDDEDDEKKVVKSAKDKYLDEIASLFDQIENYSMVQDWIKIAVEFDKLTRTAMRHTQYHIPIPRLFIKTLATLEDTILAATSAENKTKLNSSESKSFNIVRQRVKKSTKEYQDQVELYRKDPEAYENGTVTAVEDSKSEETSKSKTSGVSADGAGVFDVLRSIIETRGRKNIDQNEQLNRLEELTQVTNVPFQLISVYFLMISVRFDLNARASYMPLDQWKLAIRDVNALLTVLENNREYVVSETSPPNSEFDVEPAANENGKKEIIGSIVSFVERLADELSSHLQNIDPHATEYIERLADETTIYTLLVRAQLYYESIISASDYATEKGDQLLRVVLKRLDHIYYKPAKLIAFTENKCWKSFGSLDSEIHPKYTKGSQNAFEYSNGLIDSLCSLFYKQENSIYRKRAMLYQIYYYSLNDQYYKARDMLLMSHLQSTIHTSDNKLQVLFNRVLVQLGLSAFRAGLIVEAQQSLQEIATSPRQKDLLGQGQRFQQQQSQVDKQRYLPFHMHINIELVESCYYTASLLIEVPTMVQHPENKRRQQSSKSFRKSLEYHERQFFDGPPENSRDYIMCAAKHLIKSDWKSASDLLNSIKIWNLFSKPDELKTILRSRLQVEALRTYIFSNRYYYDKLLVSNLVDLFELPEEKVRSIVSKMIFSEDIYAGFDNSSNTIIFAKTGEVSKLQELALTFVEKVNAMVERNERVAAGGHQTNPVTGSNQQNSSNYNSQQRSAITASGPRRN